jgi:hypothetical protein
MTRACLMEQRTIKGGAHRRPHHRWRARLNRHRMGPRDRRAPFDAPRQKGGDVQLRVRNDESDENSMPVMQLASV